jgi:tellurite resistance protein TerC
VVIFTALRIPSEYQHRVLFWGILSALVMRAIMIFAGAAMIARFHWLIYLFGAFLILTGIKLFLQRGKEDSPEKSWAMRLAYRVIPSTDRFDGSRFFTRVDGRRLATPLFMALILVEITDVIFAVDSIPAIFAITLDPFIVFTSNIFAILGLRSLYFLLADLVDKFRYLKVGLAAVLVFVGVKMTIVDIYKIPALASLAVVTALLGLSIVASLLVPRKPAAPHDLDIAA